MTKIKDLKEKDRLRQPLLIKSCTKGTTSKGSPYLNLILQDNSGTIDGKFWDAKPEDMENAVAGTVAELNFEVLEYNHALQLRVNSIVPLDQKSIRMNEYLQASVYTEEELRTHAETIRNAIPMYPLISEGDGDASGVPMTKEQILGIGNPTERRAAILANLELFD